MTERMSLARLRARIRAGKYNDDLYSETVYRLMFVRWLVQQGVLNEGIEQEKVPGPEALAGRVWDGPDGLRRSPAPT